MSRQSPRSHALLSSRRTTVLTRLDPHRNCFLKPANLIAESEVYMKNQEIKNGVYKVFCMAAKNHGQNFSQSRIPSCTFASARLTHRSIPQTCK